MLSRFEEGSAEWLYGNDVRALVEQVGWKDISDEDLNRLREKYGLSLYDKERDFKLV